MVDSTRLFRVFVSSSFEDMAQERRALLDSAFAPLSELCASRGASFQAIDLRWGIGPEAALGQQTMPICLAEVRRCLRLSPRLNFLALLGDRRGWLPVPTSIPLDEYRLLAGDMTAEDRRLVDGWYRLDRNAVPPALWLRPRTGPYVDQDEWEAVECRLHDILQRVVHRLPERRQRAYVGSAVEQEVAAGVLDVRDPVGAFAIVRHRGESNGSNDEDQHVRRLDAELRGRLPSDRVLTYTSSTEDPSGAADNLKELAAAVYTRFAAVIESELEGERPGDGPGEATATHRRLAEQLLAVASMSADAAMSPRARLVGRDDVAEELTRFGRQTGRGAALRRRTRGYRQIGAARRGRLRPRGRRDRRNRRPAGDRADAGHDGRHRAPRRVVARDRRRAARRARRRRRARARGAGAGRDSSPSCWRRLGSIVPS